MTDNINWDEILEETMGKLYADKEFRDLVKHTRIGENLSLAELSEKIGVSEDVLSSFEQGERVDHTSQMKISMWFFEIEKEKVIDDELKDKFELCYLLCKFVLYGSDKQWEKFFKFINSLPKGRNPKG